MIFIPLSPVVLFIYSVFSFLSLSGGVFSSDSMSIKLGGDTFGSHANFNESFGELGPPFLSPDYVIYDPVEIQRNVTTSIVAKYGDSVQFECYASSPLPVRIIWKKNQLVYNSFDRNLLPNGQSEYESNILQFPSVTQKSQGTYECSARTSNSYDKQLYTLEVKAEPLMIETTQKHNIGSSILLICSAYCNPKSEFKWYKNGQLLTIESRDEVDSWHRDSIDHPVDGLLDISTKKNDYEGSYKCEIENEFGKVEQVFEVNGPVASATP